MCSGVADSEGGEKRPKNAVSRGQRQGSPSEGEWPVEKYELGWWLSTGIYA